MQCACGTVVETNLQGDLRDASIVVLSEAPLTGADRNLVVKLIDDVELQPGWISSVCTTSVREDGRPRKPAKKELQRCSTARDAQLAFFHKCKWLILVGETPLHLYRPDVLMSRTHGRPFQIAPEMYGFGIYHPAAALRNPAWIQDMRADLELLVLLQKKSSVWTSVPNTCVTCGETPTEEHWDAQGFPYCERHWKNSGL